MALADGSDLPERGEKTEKLHPTFFKQPAWPAAPRLKLNLSAKPKLLPGLSN